MSRRWLRWDYAAMGCVLVCVPLAYWRVLAPPPSESAGDIIGAVAIFGCALPTGLIVVFGLAGALDWAMARYPARLAAWWRHLRRF